eukprot:CAMPEP_0180063848 /NCGR_PEP_ID=MMETSP0985-20121206/7861_1 /TAXON_ID=483367 /ORGANISM="non described non described, Strain CCMP 2436" /LENGTH=101 /DNA_ID=CAMNT_0021994099 /DNA_START=75 /DNA_END=377 /DNA_ORIENTATION=-
MPNVPSLQKDKGGYEMTCVLSVKLSSLLIIREAARAVCIRASDWGSVRATWHREEDVSTDPRAAAVATTPAFARPGSKQEKGGERLVLLALLLAGALGRLG